MIITYSWEIWKLECIPSSNGLEKIVKNVFWYRRAILDDRMATVDGWSTLDSPNEESFIQYDDITQQQIISWLATVVNVDRIDRDLKDMLEADRAPPTVIATELPWTDNALINIDHSDIA
jgi:hypothetical protein